MSRMYDRFLQGPEDAGLSDWRRDLLRHARGAVLELGAGTGANLAHYPGGDHSRPLLGGGGRPGAGRDSSRPQTRRHFLFLEHVVARRGTWARRAQAALEPVWKRMAGNCHLTRETGSLIEAARFDLGPCTEEALPGSGHLIGPSVRGVARPSLALQTQPTGSS